MKKSKVVLNILSVFCFIYGAIYCFSLVFIPVGVYCFIAGRLFSKKAEHVLDNYTTDKKTLTRYFIFVSISCFPFGLLSILAYYFIYGNNVKVDNFNYIKINDVEKDETDSGKTELNSETEEIAEKLEVEEKDKTVKESEETEEEKLEKLSKLEKFKEKGIITEEEFELARQQMFGKKDE